MSAVPRESDVSTIRNLTARVTELEEHLRLQRQETTRVKEDLRSSIVLNVFLGVLLFIIAIGGIYQTSLKNEVQSTVYMSGNYTLHIAHHLEKLAGEMKGKLVKHLHARVD